MDTQIIANRFGKKYDTCFAKKVETGWEIWGQNVSSHPWKGREYPAHLIATISAEEMETIRELERDEYDRQRKKADQKASANEARAEWIRSLPNKLDEETLIDKNQGIFTDLWGNYLLSLPKIPVDNLREYFDRNFTIPE